MFRFLEKYILWKGPFPFLRIVYMYELREDCGRGGVADASSRTILWDCRLNRMRGALSKILLEAPNSSAKENLRLCALPLSTSTEDPVYHNEVSNI